MLCGGGTSLCFNGISYYETMGDSTLDSYNNNNRNSNNDITKRKIERKTATAELNLR